MSNIDYNTGPKIFLRRLYSSGIDLSKIQLLNPSINEINNYKKTKKLLIGRLDGTSYYNFSARNLEKFLFSRDYLRLSNIISKLPNFKSRKLFDILLNRYLDRTCSWLINNADGLIFQSRISLEMHKKFLSFKENSKPYCIIYNGINTEKFFPNKTPLKSFGFPSIIISASKYRLHKRLQDAIRLVNFLSKDYPNIKLNILGDLDSLTEECIKKMDISKCFFHGKIKPSELPFYYQNSHIQLHLSIFDPCPNVVVEGLACGLPVITPFESGAKELVGYKNKSWVVNEGLSLEYCELHLSNKIPQIDLQQYAKVFKNILQNLKKYQLSARERAIKTLDIKLIHRQYKTFFKKIDKHYKN